MKFNSKKYQIFKLKTYLKEKDFLIFQCAKSNLKQWTITEQHLKKLELKYYKPFKGVSFKILSISTFKYFSRLLNGPVIFIEYDSKNLNSDFHVVLKKLDPEFILLAVKFNNNVYIKFSLNKLQSLNYKSSQGYLCKTMDSFSSSSYLS